MTAPGGINPATIDLLRRAGRGLLNFLSEGQKVRFANELLEAEAQGQMGEIGLGLLGQLGTGLRSLGEGPSAAAARGEPTFTAEQAEAQLRAEGKTPEEIEQARKLGLTMSLSTGASMGAGLGVAALAPGLSPLAAGALGFAAPLLAESGVEAAVMDEPFLPALAINAAIEPIFGGVDIPRPRVRIPETLPLTAGGRGSTAALPREIKVGVGAGTHTLNPTNVTRSTEAIPSIRGKTREEALDMVMQGQHLKQGAEGRIVGGPDWVRSVEDLETIRTNFDSMVERGAIGGDWYQRAREGVTSITRRDLRSRVAQEFGLFSAQAEPPVNLRFSLSERMRAIAGTEPGARTAQQAAAFGEQFPAGPISLGPKTGEFGSRVDPTKLPDPVSAVNDIWHARAWGYRQPGTNEPFSSGLKPAQHSFLDAETLLAVERANASNLGGRSNWIPEEVQAAAWVGTRGEDTARKQAAKRLGLSQDDRHTIPLDDLLQEEIEFGIQDASKEFTDAFPTHVAQSTFEAIPGVSTALFPALRELTPEGQALRQQFSNDPASQWFSERGGDALLDEMGVLNLPTQTTQGVFRGSGGNLELNPAFISRPLVALQADRQLGRIVSDESASLLTKVEALRAFMDAQEMGAWHKIIPEKFVEVPTPDAPIQRSGALVRGLDAVTIDFPGSTLTPEQIVALEGVLEPHGFSIVPTGDGISIGQFDPDVQTRGTDLKKLFNNTLNAEIRDVLGEEVEIGFGLWQGAAPDFTDEWKQVGTGAVTEKLFTMLDDAGSPRAAELLEASETVRERAAARMLRNDEVAEQLGGGRQDIENALSLLAEGGLKLLREGLESGQVALPLLAAAMLGSRVVRDERR